VPAAKDAWSDGSNVNRGVAGRSARREHERRAEKDAARVAARRAEVRERFGEGLVGRVAEAMLVDDAPRRSTTAWSAGARGEEVVAARLDAMRDAGVVALHDRRIPGSRANIDHIAVTPGGVWVVDAKAYAGKRPDLVTEGGFLGIGARRRLVVGGRRKDALVEGVVGQVERVRAALPADVPVRGMLCFVDGDWPLIGGHFSVDGVRVVWPRRMVVELGVVRSASVDVNAVVRLLSASFPPA